MTQPLTDKQLCDFQWRVWELLRNPSKSEEVYSYIKAEYPDMAEEFVWLVLQAGLECYGHHREERWTTNMNVVSRGKLLLGQEKEDFENDLLYGWFVRGDVNIVHGFSGSGKSRLLLEIEDALRSDREFLGCSRPLDGKPLYICLDRDVRGLRGTLKDMGLPIDFVDAIDSLRVNGELDEKSLPNLKKSLTTVVKDFAHPEMVVVEGLDILVGNVNKGTIVAGVLKVLQELGRETGCCFVGTVGSPKRQSTKDRYANSRHAIIGHQAWSRCSRTTVGVEMEMSGRTSDRKETGYRVINVDTRGKPLKYRVGFNSEGRMFEDPGLKVEINPAEDMGYRETLAKAMQTIQDLSSMSEATFYRRKKKVQ